MSTAGYRIKCGRNTLRYILTSDPVRYVTVPTEYSVDPFELRVYMDMASEWLEKDRIVCRLSDEDREIIAERIAQCLTLLKCNFCFQRYRP